MKKTNIFQSLKIKLTALVCLLIFTTISGVSFVVYLTTIDRIEADLGKMALSIARTAAVQIDGDLHEKMARSISVVADMKEFKRLNEYLRKVKETNQLETDVYTYFKTWWVEEDYISFLGSSSTEPFQANKGQIMQEENRIPLIEGKEGYSDIVENINGEWITGFAPIKTSKGKVSGVLEVALNTSDEVQTAKNELLMSILSASMIAFVIGVLLTYLAASKITNPIEQLTHITQKMSEGDLTARSEVKGRDEVAFLANNFNNMASNLQSSYQKLEDYNLTLEQKVDEKTAALKHSQGKIKEILDHIEQGIFTFDDGGVIGDEFSAFLLDIFELEAQALEKSTALDLLFQNAKLSNDSKNSAVESIKSIFGNNSISWDLNEHLLPRDMVLNINNKEKYLAIEWLPMFDDNEEVSRIMVSVRDISKQKQLQEDLDRANSKSEHMVVKIREIVKNKKNSLDLFFKEANEHIKSVDQVVAAKGDPSRLTTKIHTIKGNSRVLGLTRIKEFAHEVEEDLKFLSDNSGIPLDEEDNFSAKWSLLKDGIAEYYDVYKDIFLGSTQANETERQYNLHQIVADWITDAKHLLGKRGIHMDVVNVSDQVLYWDNFTFEKISEIMVHALSNAIDHGFIRPSEKGLKHGEVGINIDAYVEDGKINLKVIDNGGGLKEDILQNIANEYGFTPSAGQSLSDVLFLEGISTADYLTDVSGRGVGLTAIKKAVDELKGKVSLRNLEGKSGAVLHILFDYHEKPAISA